MITLITSQVSTAFQKIMSSGALKWIEYGRFFLWISWDFDEFDRDGMG